MLIPILSAPQFAGYIAGTADGIVSINGEPASRKIYVFDALTLQWQATAKSNQKGRYLILGLNPQQRYLIMVRDHQLNYEPYAYDHVRPADDLSVNEQQQLWAAWHD